MLTINNNCNSELTIKKSKFITNLYKIDTIHNIEEILNNIKKEHKNATHICYAYIIDGIYKSNDDNEPNGTAGIPMLDILIKNNLNNILAVTIRYFGGIKLGAGGLIRAYSKGVKECLKKTKIIEVRDTLKITVTFEINKLKLANLLLRDYEIVKKTYKDEITFEVLIPLEEKDKIIDILFKNKFNVKA